MTLSDNEIQNAIGRVNGLSKTNPDKLLDALIKVFQDQCKILRIIDEALVAPLQPGETPLDKLIERIHSTGSNHES